MEFRERLRIFKRKFTFPINRGDIVLDVGSGNDPHPRADILVDLTDTFLERKDSELVSSRQGELCFDSRLVIADATRLPFRDKAVDFVILSHVLEHVPDPDQLLRELNRVAKAGYIETPSPLLEKVRGNSDHKWVVGLQNSKLFIAPIRERDLELYEFFNFLWWNDPAFMRFYWAHWERFHTRYIWEGKIDFEISTPPWELSDEQCRLLKESSRRSCGTVDERSSTLERRGKAFAKTAIRYLFRDKRREGRAKGLIVCPGCYSQLEHTNKEQRRCENCGCVYKTYQGAPVLLVQEQYG